MSACPDPGRLARFLDDLLGPVERRDVEGHVETCGRCQGRLDRLTADAADWPFEPAARPGDTPLPPTVRHPPPAVDVPGLTDVPGFRFLTELGRGATGAVYLAERVAVGDRVAVKVLLPERNSARERARFWRDAEALSRLKHQNIVEVFHVEEHAGRPFFVMPFLAGGDLDHRLNNEPMPPRAAAALAETLARAVHHAHQRGVIHRDLKPANVLVDGPTPSAPPGAAPPGGETLPFTGLDPAGVKVTDFGLARFLDGTGLATLAEGPEGTPCYMAPEQACGRSGEVGILSDVYGLGAVLYKCLTGRPPVEGVSTAEILERVKAGAIVPPRRRRPDLPTDLELICMKCLEREPARRYASAEQLAEELRRHLEGRPLAHTRPVGRLERLGLWCRREPYRAGVAVLTAALTLALFAAPVVYAVEEHLRAAEGDKAREEIGRALDVAKLHLADSQLHLAEGHLARGLGLLEQNDPAGMLWLARSLETAPPDAGDLRRVARGNLAGWRPRVCPLAGPPLSHPGVVYAIAFRPDGRAVLTAGEDGTARVWDPSDGHEIDVLQGHKARVNAAAFSADGRLVLTGSEDGTARVWDLAGRRQTIVLRNPAGPKAEGPVLAAAFRGDGGYVTVDRGGVSVWGAGGALAARHAAPAWGFMKAALSRDGATALAAIGDGALQVCETATGMARGGQPPRGTGGVQELVALSPDGRVALAAAADGTVRCWETATGAPAGPPIGRPRGSGWHAAVFSADGRTLLTGGADGVVRLWDVATGRPFGACPRHLGEVRAVAFSPDGKTLLTGGADLTARLWEAPPREALRGVLPQGGLVLAVAYSPDGRIAATAGAKGMPPGPGEVRLWDAVTGEPLGAPLRHDGVVAALAFSPGGDRLLAGCWDHKGYLWDVNKRIKVNELVGHGDSVGSVAFSPDGRLAATADHGGEARLWNASTGAPAGGPFPHGNCVYGLDFSPGGDRLVTAGGDGSARVWSTAAAVPLGRPLEHGPEIRLACFTPDGAGVFTGGPDGVVALWDPAAGMSRYRQSAHQGAVLAAALTADGQLALTGGADRKARLWEAATGRALGPDMIHRAEVRAVAFTRDGKVALTGSCDGTARLWDVATRVPLGPPLEHDAPVAAVALRPDGRGALTGGNDGTGRLWPVPEPLGGEPDRVRLWAEAASGQTLDDRGALHELDAAAWVDRRRRLDAAGGPPG